MSGKKLSRGQQLRIAMSVGGNATLADLITDKVGAQKAHHVLTFIAAYGVFVEQHGREPRSISELARSATPSRSSATIERYGAVFREAFPDMDMPGEFWNLARESIPFLNTENDEVAAMQLGATPL